MTRRETSSRQGRDDVGMTTVGSSLVVPGAGTDGELRPVVDVISRERKRLVRRSSAL